jgi:hypothetical protein
MIQKFSYVNFNGKRKNGLNFCITEKQQQQQQQQPYLQLKLFVSL